MRRVLGLCGFLLLLSSAGGALAKAPKARVRILVYTRNYTPDGKGYVHQNIAASVAAFRAIGQQHGIAVDVSEDPDVFTPARLAQYNALVFSNSNNEAFATDAQRDAFRAYTTMDTASSPSIPHPAASGTGRTSNRFLEDISPSTPCNRPSR